ncbi:hypothetical protein, partial [Streptomyces sp. I05A-00742]|uniref:hypothetical protein n=1 Tax=Streptomyces sp. I05A-00742 TaxID=2732853 RepID=UPI001BB1E845
APRDHSRAAVTGALAASARTGLRHVRQALARLVPRDGRRRGAGRPAGGAPSARTGHSGREEVTTGRRP